MKLSFALLGLGLLATGCSTTQDTAPPRGILLETAELLARSPATDPFRVSVEGRPEAVWSPLGPAVAFDGFGDRIVLEHDLLAGSDAFTVEVVFRPRDVYPDSSEPRFLHIESASNPARRLTMELRLTASRQWYLDAFLMSESDRMTLADAHRLHPVGEWFHAALTYSHGTFTTYVNGERELVGSVRFEPMPADARASIGARLNRVHWFAGEIASVRVTPAALAPRGFPDLPRVLRH